MTGDIDIDVFEERESLRRIRDYARMRQVGPLSVLGGVFLKVCAATGPGVVMIPPIVGTPKPLNLAVISVGPSGFGKTAADDVADEYWPTATPVWPLGTAEGTCQAFDPDEDGQPQQPDVIFASSEIDTWAALGERAGSMIFPVLRQIITGDQIGQKNASKDRSRVVNKRSYSGQLSLGAQPASRGAQSLLADASRGFPQRCVFFSVLDSDAPLHPPTGVKPLRPPMPEIRPNAGDLYLMPFPDAAVEQVRDHRYRVLRGDSSADPLDGHRNLTRCKVAAALALVEGRLKVTDDDWRIAGTVMEISDRTRAGLIAATEQAARTANRARALASADRDEVISDRRLYRTKQAVVRWLGRDGESSSTELRRKIKADLRDNLNAAISELAAEGQIVIIDVERGTRYRLTATSTRCTTSTPPKDQFRDGVPEVHGVPVDNVTDLDSRRSAESARPKVTAVQWFADHIAELRAAGHTTVPAFAVYQAGEAAGYPMSTLGNAARAHPDIAVIDRTGGKVTWSIEPGEQHTYRPVREWLDNYLDSLDRTEVTPDEVRIAGQAAGYGWETVRATARDSPRIRSVPARGRSKSDRIWHIINPPNDGEESA